VADLHFN